MRGPLPGRLLAYFPAGRTPAVTDRPDRCASLHALYPRRAVRALDLQIVSAENPVANPYLRVIDVVAPAAAVVALPDLAVGKPNARARKPAFEMARNSAFDRLRFGRFIFI